jgi:hypothetical protein
MPSAPGVTRVPLTLAVAVALLSLASCSPPRDAPVLIVDAVFAGLRSGLGGEAGRAGLAYVELGAEANEAELQAAIEREAGRSVALSPLLAGGIRPGALSGPTAVYGLAFEDQVVPPEVIPIRFLRADAARAAAAWLVKAAHPSQSIAAIFVGDGAQKAAEEFLSVFIAARRANLPIVEWTDSDWSEDSAERLRSSASEWAYLAVPTGHEARWLEALPSSVSAVVEAYAPAAPTTPAVQAWATWDIEASLRELASLSAGREAGEPMVGRWKVLSAGRKRRF